MSCDADDIYNTDEPRLCPIHGEELDLGDYCESCHLATYEASLTWDADDEADDRYERSRDMEFEAAA